MSKPVKQAWKAKSVQDKPQKFEAKAPIEGAADKANETKPVEKDNRRVVGIGWSLSEPAIKELEKCGVRLRCCPNEQHDHGVLAAERLLAEDLALQRAFKAAPTVVDVGGNPRRHAMRGRKGVYCLCPNESPKDHLRAFDRETADVSGPWCPHDLLQFANGECCDLLPAGVGSFSYLLVDSLYYIAPEELWQALGAVGAVCAYAVIHDFPQEIPRGTFPTYVPRDAVEAQWHRTADGDIVEMVGRSCVPYSHRDLEWLTGGCKRMGESSLIWEFERAVGDARIYKFIRVSAVFEQKPLQPRDALLPDAVGPISCDGPFFRVKDGPANPAYDEIIQIKTMYSLGPILDVTLKDDHHVRIPKSLLGTLAVRSQGERSPDAYKQLRSRAKELSRSLRGYEELWVAQMLPYACALGYTFTLDDEMNAAKMLAEKQSQMNVINRTYQQDFALLRGGWLQLLNASWKVSVSDKAVRTTVACGAAVAAIATTGRLIPRKMRKIYYAASGFTAGVYMLLALLMSVGLPKAHAWEGEAPQIPAVLGWGALCTSALVAFVVAVVRRRYQRSYPDRPEPYAERTQPDTCFSDRVDLQPLRDGSKLELGDQICLPKVGCWLHGPLTRRRRCVVPRACSCNETAALRNRMLQPVPTPTYPTALWLRSLFAVWGFAMDRRNNTFDDFIASTNTDLFVSAMEVDWPYFEGSDYSGDPLRIEFGGQQVVIIRGEFSVIPLEFTVWLGRFPLARRTLICNALKMRLDPSTIHRAFVKRELLPVTLEELAELCTFVPRMIQASTPDFQARCGPWIFSFSKLMARAFGPKLVANCHVWPQIVYSAGLNGEDLGRWFDDALMDGLTFMVKGDSKRFDAHVARIALEVEHAVMQLFGVGDHPEVKLCLDQRLNSEGFTRLGAWYALEGTRQTGDNDTSCGNTLIQMLKVECMCHDAGIKHADWRAVVMGDDVMIAFRAAVDRDRFVVSEVPMAMGFEDEWLVADHPEEGEFCSRRPYPTAEGHVFAPKLGRWFAKCGVSLHPVSPATFFALLRKQWAREATVMPFIGILLEHFKVNTTIAEDEQPDDRYVAAEIKRWRDNSIAVISKHRVGDWLLFMNRVYGLSVEECRSFEQYLRHLEFPTNVGVDEVFGYAGLDPHIYIDHPVLDVLLDVDCPLKE